MKNQHEYGIVYEVKSVFGPTINKLLSLVIFFYVCLIGVNAIVFFEGLDIEDIDKADEWYETHKPSRLTDILSDAGMLTLGAALGIMKNKFSDNDDDEKPVPTSTPTKDHYEDENIDWSKGA